MVFLIIFRNKKIYIQIIRQNIQKRLFRKIIINVIEKAITKTQFITRKKKLITFQLHWKKVINNII